jgi:hypothetical protein
MTAAAQATVHELRQGIAPVSPANLPQVSVGLADLQSFELAQRVAKLFSASSLVPKDYQGNLPNCVIALNMAARIGADPMMVMQNLYVVHGRPGWSAQFMIATFNACGRFSSIRYEFDGQDGSDDWRCRAWAVEKETGERIEGAWVSIGLAKKEGWYGKNGSKWQTMPMQMLQYRAASWFIRAYAPEIAMGIQTVDEVRDTWDMREEAPGVYTMTTDDARQTHGVPPEEPETPAKTTHKAKSTEARVAAAEAATAGQAEPAAPVQGQEGAAPEPPASVVCPVESASDGEEATVYVTVCEKCPEKPDCPSWK